MKRTVVLSFYVKRRAKDFGLQKVAPYLDMLAILDRSCARAGLEHIVLTDDTTSQDVTAAGLTPFMTELPRSLMQATTEIQACWLESPHSKGVDSVFVGADCIVRQDFRPFLPRCDLAIAFMKGHKKWRLNNGFMYVPAESRERVAPIFRLIADDTRQKMGDDMTSIERALVPMPADYGTFSRRGVDVAFLPLNEWNYGYQMDPADPASHAYVLHFMGDWKEGKPLFFAWAKNHGFA